jgi:ribosomal protein S12 methylthiotransferase
LKKKLNIITMGCSKNLADSEQLMRRLHAMGFEVVHDARLDSAPVAVVNTCGFIKSAREESVNMIMQCVRAKNDGYLTHLFVMGCLSELYKQELQKEIPEVDGFFGARNLEEVVSRLAGDYRGDLRAERTSVTPAHYAYLKIAEGCDRTCAFCSIPYIRGAHRSVPMEEVEAEARFLTDSGAKELLLISQDTTYYGIDLYHKAMLPDLVRRLCQNNDFGWLRLHYAYPLHFPMQLLDAMNADPRVCRYVDIPVQHISDKVLAKMRRNITGDQTRRLLAEIRERVPGVALRTTLIVGHPGETEKDFEELLHFVEETRFERLGVFTYSHEDHTYAGEHYRDRISQKVKDERARQVMKLQEGISLELNRARIGQTLNVLIDREDGDYYAGRTEFDSPEVDGEVMIAKAAASSLRAGEFHKVRIIDADEYDLYGEATSA